MVFNFSHGFYIFLTLSLLGNECYANDILGCGGFVKSDVKLDFSKLEVGLYTPLGSLKEKTECAPTNGYYFLPLYEKGDYVLKVHPPPGWSIEPSEVNLSIDGSTDPCSTGQDINFSFNGFGITGNVITAGQTRGPSGVTVQLVNQKGERRETVTDKEGNFHFTPVIPGKYTVKASHPKWKLDPASAEVQVSGANTALPTGSLSVKGYDVQGTVTANKNPIPGVYVLLYSKKENNAHRVEGCNTALLQGVPGNPICHAVTDASGTFNFGLVPAGDYRLVPLAKQPGKAKVIYEIKPTELEFTVRHNSLNIENAFEVTGFTVIGRVVSVLNGEGLKSVQVLLNGQPMGVTDKDGYYTLPNLKANTYSLNFAAEQCEFSESSFTVSPSGLVSLSDAWPTRWRVCGDVTLAAADARARTISLQTEQRSMQTPPIHLQSDPANGGKWCTFLAPGVYIASVVVTDQERQDGLQFFPLTVSVRVGGAAVGGVSFSQLRAEVGGAVVRLRAGPALSVSLRALALDGTYAAQPAVQLYTKNDKYLFTEVLPGSYEVSVGSESLCWASAKHNVAVTSAKAAVPDFVQTGYSVTLSASHEIEVEYKHKDNQGVRGKLLVSAGVSQQCLPKAGDYILTPIGCHQYHHDTINYNTDQGHNVIAINAVSHTNVIRVLVDEHVDDLRLKVIRETEEVFGPLKPLNKKEDGYFVYEHTIMLAMGEVSVIHAESSWVVWSGAGSRQLVGGGDCNPSALLLRGRRGVRLQGSVTPHIAGVTVTLLTNGEILHTYTTEHDGKYNFGPLDASKTYTLAAEKDSYILSGPDDSGNFKAHKLAEIKVTVVDESSGKPLQSALVSVSGGQYRRNLATGVDGALAFTSLAPAQYFVKPLMKEYRFTPPHTIVDVSEGQSYDVKLSGKRVACSAMGRVVWVSGAGVGGAVVWARAVAGEDSVTTHCPDEEAVSEAEGGAFRVRGLHRGCQYQLTLKHAVGANGAPLKVAPNFIHLDVQSDTEDIEGLRLVAMERPQLTDVNILVYTPLHEHYKTLHIRLALENEPSTVVYSSKVSAPGLTPDVNPGALYAAPRLPADNRSYVLQLDSTLSTATHAYTLQPVYFKSDGNFKQFSFQFLPKVKVSEQDMGQTPFMLIPGLIALALVVYNKDKVLTVLRDFASDLADKVQKPTANKSPSHSGAQVELDESQIDQIVQNINSVKKRSNKPKKI